MEFFVIADQADQILGRVFHFKTVPYFQSREIGYSMFTDEVRGKGIMTEAVTLLRDYLFDTTLLNRLEIHMNTENKASERVAVKCGFQLGLGQLQGGHVGGLQTVKTRGVFQDGVVATRFHIGQDVGHALLNSDIGIRRPMQARFEVRFKLRTGC